jgi:uncharacterized membrane protein
VNTEVLPPEEEESLRKLKNVALAGYALQALAFFLGGIPAVVAVVLAYVKRDDARGTWLESHLRWQIRTFWIALLGGIIGVVTFIIHRLADPLRHGRLGHLPHRQGLARAQ